MAIHLMIIKSKVKGLGYRVPFCKNNTGENGVPANNTINYTYSLSNNDQTLEITIQGWNAEAAEATW